MTPSDRAAARAREVMEQARIEGTTVTLTRYSLVQALNMAADVMQNSAAVAKSDAWQGHYRQLMKDYREAANMVGSGAKFAIK